MKTVKILLGLFTILLTPSMASSQQISQKDYVLGNTLLTLSDRWMPWISLPLLGKSVA